MKISKEKVQLIYKCLGVADWNEPGDIRPFYLYYSKASPYCFRIGIDYIELHNPFRCIGRFDSLGKFIIKGDVVLSDEIEKDIRIVEELLKPNSLRFIKED